MPVSRSTWPGVPTTTNRGAGSTACTAAVIARQMASTSPGGSAPRRMRSSVRPDAARQAVPPICTPTAPARWRREMLYEAAGAAAGWAACGIVITSSILRSLNEYRRNITMVGQLQHAPVRRIAVSTGGGDCPGLNAVIRAVVKTAISVYGWEVLGIETGFDGLLGRGGARVRPLTAESVRGILPLGGTILGTSNRGNPFAMPAEGGGTIDRSHEVVERLRELEIDALVTIGGDGSMRIASQLQEMGVRLVGVPKTIDNDLEATDVTFGFDSALHVATEAIDRLHSTAESHNRVFVIEV